MDISTQLKALADPAVTERLSRLTIEPRLMKPQEFDDFLRKDVDTARRMLQAAGVHIHQRPRAPLVQERSNFANG